MLSSVGRDCVSVLFNGLSGSNARITTKRPANFVFPSRSAQRRAALDVLELGEVLVALTATQLGKLPIPDELLPHIRDTQRI